MRYKRLLKYIYVRLKQKSSINRSDKKPADYYDKCQQDIRQHGIEKLVKTKSILWRSERFQTICLNVELLSYLITQKTKNP